MANPIISQISVDGTTYDVCDAGIREGTYLLDRFYPIGSIYQSTVSTNPGTLFGGTWEQLKDRFLLGAGSSYSNGATGGEAAHKLTETEMPSHTHKFTGASATSSTASNHTHSFTTNSVGSHTHDFPMPINEDTAAGQYVYGTQDRRYSWSHIIGGANWSSTSANGSHNHTGTTDGGGSHSHTLTAKGSNANTGGSGSHNNMPPYLVIYMWKRTA